MNEHNVWHCQSLRFRTHPALCNRSPGKGADAGSIYCLPGRDTYPAEDAGRDWSKFSTVNDTFLARVAVPVVVRDVTVLAAGTLVEGRIIAASPAGLGNRNGRIDLRMETLKFSAELIRSIDGVPVKPFEAKHSGGILPVVGGSILGAAVGLATGSVPGILIGAGLGGGIGAGASYSRRGNEIRLKEDDVFEIELKKEVVLPVLDY